MKAELTADLLYNRHRLSYPQIDSLLGTNHKNLYQKDIIENFKIIREFIRVTDEFRRMGIRFIPLKGPLLSQRIYGDATVRRFHDLDILIDFKDIALIYNYLILCGYCPDLILSVDEKEKLMLFNQAKHILFIHPQTKVCIEIHWKITSDLRSFYSVLDSIYGQITTYQVFMNRKFWVLNKEYDLLYLLVHGSIHNWERLKWLIDINDYMQNILFDNLQVNILAEQHRISRLFALYNSIAKIYLPKPTLFETIVKTSGFLERICIQHIESAEVAFNTKKISDKLNFYIYNFKLFPDFGNIMAFLKTRLINFSDSKDIKTTNPFILFLYRPIGYVYRRFGGN